MTSVLASIAVCIAIAGVMRGAEIQRQNVMNSSCLAYATAYTCVPGAINWTAIR